MNAEFDKIYNLLATESFQDPNTGLLFFPSYIYTYDPKKEYEVRSHVVTLSKKLQRSNRRTNSLVINLFSEFIKFLSIDGDDAIAMNIEREKENYNERYNYLRLLASEEYEFIRYLGNLMEKHFSSDVEDTAYVLVYGIGTIWPWLRASELMVRTEKYIKGFKLILFYPGSYDNNSYSLFNIKSDDNVYRTIELNTLI